MVLFRVCLFGQTNVSLKFRQEHTFSAFFVGIKIGLYLLLIFVPFLSKVINNFLKKTYYLFVIKLYENSRKFFIKRKTFDLIGKFLDKRQQNICNARTGLKNENHTDFLINLNDFLA